MLGSGSGSICAIFSNTSSVVSCGVGSAAGEAGVTTAADEVPDDGSTGPGVLLPEMNSPFPPLFLRFWGGGGLTVRFGGDSAALARKMTSLHRLQSSSSS